MGIVILPYLAFAAFVNGDIIPTTGRGKLITYVGGGFDLDGMWVFTKNFFVYQKFLPQHMVLLTAAFIVAFLILTRHRNSQHHLGTFLFKDHLLLTSLIVWGLLHFILFVGTFRILFHHTRYLANEYVIWIILGSLGLLFVNRIKNRIPFGVVLGVIAIGLAGATMFSWGEVYANNVRHVDEAYVRMGEWINENTPPDSRIAAFDIGILRFVGDRYTIDLGGLVDPEAHPCLDRRDCADYVREKDTDYILYSRNPDVDVFPALFLAEYQGRLLLKQQPVVHFDTAQYNAPTLTHSERMDLNRIIGWYPRTPEGILQAFSYDQSQFEPIEELVDDRLEFVGYSIDQRVVRKVPIHPLIVNFTYFWKAQKSLVGPYWVHMAFFDLDGDRIHLYLKHVPTHNLLEPLLWPIDQVIQEHHVRFIPDWLPKQEFRIRVTVTEQEELDWNQLESYTWFDLGRFENRKNVLNPLVVPKG